VSAPTTPPAPPSRSGGGRTLPELARAGVGALRDTLRELDRAITLSRDLHDEAVLLTRERDAALRESDKAEEAKENMRALFDGACTDRDAALAELSSVKASLADLAERWKEAEAKVIEQGREIALRDSVISLAHASPHAWQAARTAHGLPAAVTGRSTESHNEPGPAVCLQCAGNSGAVRTEVETLVPCIVCGTPMKGRNFQRLEG
jgi:hypothetical protein